MDSLALRISQFLASGSGHGSGYGSGDGYGSGYGYGSGSGSGSGDGDGYGSGSGYGSGYGSGSGPGSSYGSGSGYGYGSGIKSMDGLRVYLIDGVQTLLTSLRGNVARGFILNQDFSQTKTFVAKVGNSFAHGDSIKSAIADATKKHMEDASPEERVEEFLKQFDPTVDHAAEDLMNGYRLLSGACEQGCLSFMQNNGIAADARFTLAQFVDIVTGAYEGGAGAVEMLKATLEQENKEKI